MPRGVYPRKKRKSAKMRLLAKRKVGKHILKEISLEDLLVELDDRGWKITIESK